MQAGRRSSGGPTPQHRSAHLITAASWVPEGNHVRRRRAEPELKLQERFSPQTGLLRLNRLVFCMKRSFRRRSGAKLEISSAVSGSFPWKICLKTKEEQRCPRSDWGVQRPPAHPGTISYVGTWPHPLRGVATVKVKAQKRCQVRRASANTCFNTKQLQTLVSNLCKIF